MLEQPPLGLYVHFPWCVAKCPYCDFNSHSLSGELPAVAYVDVLLADMERAAESLAGREISSVFLGGGTPSLFPPEQIERLLDRVRACLTLAADAEITMEANPGAIEHSAFRGYREAGVNRLSLGVQSFDDEKLRKLGRIHDSDAARNAYAEARDAGFANINLDLMYALPGQTLNDALADVREALRLAPEHLSYYHLTLEPNTVFYSRPPALPDDETAWQIQDAAAALIAAAGFDNYEVSAWARESACRHNLNYWQFGDYLGLGAGAHGKLTTPDGAVFRERRAAHPREYMRELQAGRVPLTRAPVAGPDLLFEFMLNALRLREGFSTEQFERRTGLAAGELQPFIKKAHEKQLLTELQAGVWRPSERGWRFLDDLQGLFLPEAQA